MHKSCSTMRSFFIILLFALAIHRSQCEDSTKLECKDAAPSSPAKRLKDYLFCEYDPFVRPILGDGESTVVDIKMIPQYVEFAEEENILHLHTWMALGWNDSHLTWEPSKWENIKELHVWSYDLWKPDLTVFNTGDFMDNNYGMAYTDCVVEHTGAIKCMVPSKYSSHCPTDYSEWPYDKHNCSLQLGAWTFFRDEIILHFPPEAITNEFFVANKQWDIHIERGQNEFSRFSRNEAGEVTILITVALRRHGSRLAIIYILPAFVFMVLTLIVLWLDSQSLERILVACINFICHLLGLFDLHWYFPTSGAETVPKILIFYEVSIGLAAIALIVTCLLRKLREMNVAAPMWLTSLTTFVVNSPVGTLLRINMLERKRDASILEDDSNGTIPESPKDRTWQEFATIIEWFTFSVSFLIYLIMLMIVLPPGAPKKLSANYWFR